LGVTLLISCSCASLGLSGPDQGTALPTVPVGRQDEGIVFAEAVMEPVRTSELLFTQGGMVDGVLVDEGDQVAMDELLVRLDATDALLTVSEAEAALATAKAQLAETKAGPRPQQVAEVEFRIEEAEAAVLQAESQRAELTAGATQAEVADAQSRLKAAQAGLLAAEQNRTRVYDDERDEDTKKLADYQLRAAREAVAAAEAQLAATRNSGWLRIEDADIAIELARAQLEVLEAELELLRAGTRPEEVAVSEAGIAQAEAALHIAEQAVRKTEVRAPFAATMAEVAIEEGQKVSPGQTILVLALTGQLQVRTTDLTELDISRVSVGQPATVLVDALPDVKLDGRVIEIGLRSEDYRGDIVYPVTLELVGSDPALRWGMTAQVEIETD
ncbi:MAG: HlyD family efflux transporter periplasmic adaptor subunit, partial [Anaerolineae bacterium]